mmetsp:Transcript_45518/g.33282  ORF Transcript_45518/g.33282 Transcript_45518/m.33282 type:complete len:85 (+) Transcript_45518:79-333(+)
MDFGGLLSSFSNDCKYYIDLSESGDYVEAIGKVYDLLRWAETKEDAKMVLIANLMEMEVKDAKNIEHRAALFDRVFRATSGREI